MPCAGLIHAIYVVGYASRDHCHHEHHVHYESLRNQSQIPGALPVVPFLTASSRSQFQRRGLQGCLQAAPECCQSAPRSAAHLHSSLTLTWSLSRLALAPSKAVSAAQVTWRGTRRSPPPRVAPSCRGSRSRTSRRPRRLRCTAARAPTARCKGYRGHQGRSILGVSLSGTRPIAARSYIASFRVLGIAIRG